MLLKISITCDNTFLCFHCCALFLKKKTIMNYSIIIALNKLHCFGESYVKL